MSEQMQKTMDKFLEELKEKSKDYPELMNLFVTCYTNTLDTTVKRMENNTTHVITGDIPAMWLRDSAAQLRPYIFLAKEDEEIRELIAGLVRRQFMYINIDEYANAFNHSASGDCWERMIQIRAHGYGKENLRLTLYATQFSWLTYYGKTQTV